MSETVPAPGKVRRDALNDIADSLSVLAARLRGRAAASQDFARLTEHAREIAAQAWEVQTSRWGFVENAGRLADALVAFADEAAAACVRATSETDCTLATVDALVAQSGRLAHLARRGDAGSDEVRAVLGPLEVTLTAMRVEGATGGSVTADAAALARRASMVSDYAVGLKGGGRQAGEAAAAIAKAMTGFIDEAALIANRMTGASDRLSDAVTRMASGTDAAKRRYVDRVTGVVWS
jgi:hypothetical protein